MCSRVRHLVGLPSLLECSCLLGREFRPLAQAAPRHDTTPRVSAVRYRQQARKTRAHSHLLDGGDSSRSLPYASARCAWSPVDLNTSTRPCVTAQHSVSSQRWLGKGRGATTTVPSNNRDPRRPARQPGGSGPLLLPPLPSARWRTHIARQRQVSATDWQHHKHPTRQQLTLPPSLCFASPASLCISAESGCLASPCSRREPSGSAGGAHMWWRSWVREVSTYTQGTRALAYLRQHTHCLRILMLNNQGLRLLG